MRLTHSFGARPFDDGRAKDLFCSVLGLSRPILLRAVQSFSFFSEYDFVVNELREYKVTCLGSPLRVAWSEAKDGLI